MTTTLAIAGVILGAVFGVIGTVYNFKDEVTKKLTKWGWVGVCGIILTAIFSLVSQFAAAKQEEVKLAEAKRDQTEKLKAELQRFQTLVDEFKVTHVAMERTQNELERSSQTLKGLEDSARETVNKLDRNSRPIDSLVANLVLQIPIREDGESYLKRARTIAYPWPWFIGPHEVTPGVTVLTTRANPSSNGNELVTRFRVAESSSFYPHVMSATEDESSFVNQAYSLIKGNNVQIAVFENRQAALAEKAEPKLYFRLVDGTQIIDVEPEKAFLIVARLGMTWDKLRLTKHPDFSSLDDFRGKTLRVTLSWHSVFAGLPGLALKRSKLSELLQIRLLNLSFGGRILRFETLSNRETVDDTPDKTTILFTFPSDAGEFQNLWK